MKITTVFLFAVCMHVSAKTHSQTITFTGKEVPLSKVFAVVKQQTGYVFFYNKGILRDGANINVQAKDQPLETFLRTVLQGQQLDYSIEDKVIIISRKPMEVLPDMPPPVTVNGRITDDRGVPLPGVSVKVKGSPKGTTTNSDGVFSLSNVPDDAHLVISYIGFETREVAIKGQGAINLQLTPATKDIEGVTVVGYSSRNVKYLSSAVATVSREKLRDVTSNNLNSLLQGKASGVVVSAPTGDPVAGANIVIRGQGTLAAGISPLIVVDGNIGGTFNPNDVESVTILKDAAATGLYGSRAANGVIIVTTRQGKAGKTRIELNTVVGYNEANNGKFKLMNSQQLYDYQKTFTNRPDTVLKTDTDWQDIAFRRAMTQSYTLSASGGSEKTQFYVSGNYYKEEGTLLTNSKTSYNFRTNIIHKLTDKIKMTVLLNGDYVKNNNHHSSTLYGAYTYLPWDKPYNADGTPRFGSGTGWLGREQHNFVHSLQYNQSFNRGMTFNGDLNLDYAITKHITLSTYNRASIWNYKSTEYFDQRSKEGTADKGLLQHNTRFSNTLLSSNRLRYENNFGDHNLSVLGVVEAEKYYYDDNAISGRGLPAGMTAMSTATEAKTTPTGGRDEYSFTKWLAQADYNFNNRYFFLASFVRDISSKFGNNNPGGNFYQLGASWILSNEQFLSGHPVITFLKIRGSHGTVGNPPTANYQSLGLYVYDQSASYAGLAGSYPSQKANLDLTWEKIRVNNIGLDISLFKRIDLNVDVYDKQARSLLMLKPLPLTSGYANIMQNIGSMRNRGVEFTLNTRNLVGEFKWETSFNLALNRNKVTKLNGNDKFGSPGTNQPVGLGEDMDKWYMRIWAGVDPATGDPLWEKIITDASGKTYLTYTNSYNAATLQYTGTSSAPKFTGGFLNTFSYKGFTLSAFFNFVKGNQVFNSSRQFFDSDGLYDSYNQMVLAEGWSRWSKPGDIATHPKPLLGGNKAANEPSSRFLEDGSYIRLRNVTLGYNIPESLLQRLKIGTARVFLSGDNLWTGTNFSGMDPEVSFVTSGGATKGVSGTKYPISKKFLLGVNIGF
ncbi:SusC/RagA family TonB-linked outer membrane protein [Chitinophaga lutea]|nr:SusC/RagA family TonB-linked outer membrane protein [Chitinophaga lutea]